MNKKFSTLLVGALLASSTGAFATTVRAVGHNVGLRPAATMSADGQANTITKFENKLYQLTDANGNVLVQQRDLTTGVLTMKLVLPTDAPINASLWSINVKSDGNSGFVFTYVNKETGMPLAIDIAKTLKSAVIKTTIALDTEAASVVEGCLQDWAWYTTNDNGATAFPQAKVYSYFTQDSVAVLQENSAGDVITVKYSKAVAGTGASSVTQAITLQPVLAEAIVLSADDLNRKVDYKYLLSDAANAMNVAASDTFSIASSTVPTTASVFLTNQFKATTVGTDISLAGGYDADMVGITAANPESDYVYLQTTAGEYLYVSPDFYPNQSKFLKLDLSATKLAAAGIPAGSGMTEATWRARSAFKVTYYPSQDSLVFEPLNALSKNPANGAWLNGDFAFNSVNNKISAFYNGVVTVGNVADLQDATIGQVVIRIGDLTATESVITAYNTELDGFAMPGSLKTKFTYADRTFSYLTRATLAPNLYKITRVADTKRVVCNFNGTVIFDAIEKYSNGALAQNFDDMPATMWVVDATGCTTVDVKNREYGANTAAFTASMFNGQLYVDAAGNYFTINTNYVVGVQTLNNVASYSIDAVTDTDALTSARHGYKNLTDLIITKYNLAYNLFVDQELFLDVTTDNNFAPSKSKDAFFEAEAVAGATDVAFGAGVGVNGIPQLLRTAYTLKVKDVNLIDNDKYYVFLVNKDGEMPYYYAMTDKQAADMDALTTTAVSKAVFYLKADQVKGSDKYYVLIDINNSGLGTTASALTLTGVSNGLGQAHCLDNVGRLSYETLDNIASSRASAFAIGAENVVLYRTIADAKTANIFRQRGTAKEYLFEDSNNQVGAPSYVKDFGYLGLTSEGIAPKGKSTTAMYVKYVNASSEVMPQYLFSVDTATVADGKWCATDEHGYVKEGDAHSDHTTPYIGYLAGSFLVNLTDSIEGQTGMLNNADKFKYAGYDRLGFVEAIYRVENNVEYLYILTGGNTLESVQATYGVVDPAMFADATVFDKKTLNGTHANYVFSLRLTNEEVEKDFLIESNGVGSGVGSFKGAWVKVQNSCPVLAKFTTTGSDHADDVANMQELINNAQIFNIQDGLDETATGNDNIDAVSTVSVIAENGAVRVLNANGKTVTIANVLGQIVSKSVVTSDNATISVPAGVVIVSVDGEAAVKAIIK